LFSLVQLQWAEWWLQ